MTYPFGGLSLANVGDIVTMSSVSTNLQTLLKNSAGATAPTLVAGDSYRQGQTWYDTSVLALKQWDGTQWVGIGGGAVVSGTPPTLPQTGELWYDSVNTGRTYIWDTTTWVDAAPSAGASVATTGSGAPNGATPGFDSQGALYVNISVVPNDMYVSDGLGVWNLAGGGGTFDSLTDVDVATKVTLQSGIMWDATAVSGGVTGQWVPNQIYDASPTGGASNDF